MRHIRVTLNTESPGTANRTTVSNQRGTMQEAPNVQWDIREPAPLSAISKLYFFFLVACCIWAVVVLLKTLWKTRNWPSTRRGNLISLSKALHSANPTEASTLAAKIPESSPESGLRALTALKSIALHELPGDLIAQADLRFTYVLSALRVTATNLKYLAALLLILTGAWTTFSLSNITSGISATKATGISALYGGVTEVLVTLCISLSVLAFLYILHWRLVSLLSRRERLWQLLKSQLQLLLNPSH